MAGTAGGRTLTVPAKGTRPTSDRVREALFSRLEHFGVLRGARVLDLFAGSGALGLEAASRGATHITLVERSQPAAQVCRSNIDALALPGVELITDRAERFVTTPPAQPWDVVLIDPPYDFDDTALSAILQSFDEPDALAEGAVVVVERARRSAEPDWPRGWDVLAHKDYGDTALWFAGPPMADDAA